MQIGSVDGSGHDALRRVRQVVLFEDGRIAVVDSRPPEILLFGPRGEWLTTMGREGEGPGEFGVAPSIAFAPPDTIVAWDPMYKRLTWFSTSGQVLGDASLLSSDYAGQLPKTYIPLSWSVGGDGTLVTVRKDRTGGRSAAVIAVVGAEELRTIRTFDLPPRSRTGRLGPGRVTVEFHSPFAGWPSAVLGGVPRKIFVSSPSRWEIGVHGMDGALQDVIRPGIARFPVTPGAQDTLRAAAVSRYGSLDRRSLEEAYDRLEHPDSVAAIQSLLWDPAGFLWVQRRLRIPDFGPARFEVFDEAGQWRGWLELPAEAGHLHDVAHGRLATLWRDDLGVPYVRVYRLIAPD